MAHMCILGVLTHFAAIAENTAIQRERDREKENDREREGESECRDELKLKRCWTE